MTPEEIQQQAQMRAMALRGQELQSMQREADGLSGIGGAFAGWGGKTGRAVSEGAIQRGDALRALASQGQRQQDEFGHADASQGRQFEQQKDLAGINNSAEMERLKLQLADKERHDKADKGAKVSEAEGKYRKELYGLQVVKDAMGMGAAYQGINQALNANTPAGDMAGIFQFMKVLDPTSSVREGEYANAQNATNVPTQVLNLYNKARSGKLLDPAQRKDFLGTAKGRYHSQLKEAKRYADAFGGLAQQDGGDPLRVTAGLNFTDLDEDQQAPTSGAGDTVMVVPPGQTQPIPVHRSKVEEAVKRGGKVVSNGG